MNIKKTTLILGVLAAMSPVYAYAIPPLILPPDAIVDGTGPTGVSPIQLSQDIGWLGQVVAAASDAIQTQEQADQTAEGKQLTQQDKNLAATQKEQNAATCQQNVLKEFPLATLNLPNGQTITPIAADTCSTSGGNHMNAAGAMANAFLNKGALTNFIVNGGSGAPTPATSLGISANPPGSMNYNLGNAYPSVSAAKQHIANTTHMSQFSATSSLVQFTKGKSADTDAANLQKYIGDTTNPTPSPQLSKYVQNTPDGKMYLATLREEAADLSLSSGALGDVGGLNLPSAKVGNVIFTKNSSKVLGSLENAVNTLTNLTGISSEPSINQFLESTASSYFLNGSWYSKVQQNGGNPSYYDPTSLYMKAAGLEMQYQTLRQTELQTSLLAQMYAQQVREVMAPKLNELRSAAEQSH